MALGGLSASFAGWGAGGFAVAVAVAAASGLLLVAVVVGHARSLWVQRAGGGPCLWSMVGSPTEGEPGANINGSSHTAGRVWGGGHMSLSRTSLRPTCQRRAHDSEALG